MPDTGTGYGTERRIRRSKDANICLWAVGRRSSLDGLVKAVSRVEETSSASHLLVQTNVYRILVVFEKKRKFLLFSDYSERLAEDCGVNTYNGGYCS